MKAKAKIIAKLSSRGWVSLQQMATLIGVSYPTMLAIQRRKEIKCVRVGRVWRIYSDEVERYLREGNVPKTKPKLQRVV